MIKVPVKMITCGMIECMICKCNKRNWYKNRTCYYFEDIIKFQDFNFGSILIHEKSYENILDDNISYKFLIGTKPLRIRLDKVEGFIRVNDGTRYLISFGPEK